MQDHAECHQDSPVLRLWRGGRKLCQGSSYSRCLRSLTHTNTSITLINHVIDQCTYSWHGDHEEIDAIPIGQCILPFSCICEVRGVATIFKLRESKLNTHTLQDQNISGKNKNEMLSNILDGRNQIRVGGGNQSPTKWIIPAAVSHTDTKIDISWASLEIKIHINTSIYHP